MGLGSGTAYAALLGMLVLVAVRIFVRHGAVLDLVLAPRLAKKVLRLEPRRLVVSLGTKKRRGVKQRRERGSTTSRSR